MYRELLFTTDMMVLTGLIIVAFLLVPLDQQDDWVKENTRLVSRLILVSLLLVTIGMGFHLAIQYLLPNVSVQELTVNYSGANHTIGKDLYVTYNGERIPLRLRLEYGYIDTMSLGLLGAFVCVVDFYILLDEKYKARGETG